MYKGKYNATIEIEFHIDEKTRGLLSFDEVKRNICDGDMTELIIEAINDYVIDSDFATIHIKQENADLWKENEHDN